MCTRILSAASCVCYSRVRFVLSSLFYMQNRLCFPWKPWGLLNCCLASFSLCYTVFSHGFCKIIPQTGKMSRPWTRSMPNQPEEVYGTQTSNDFTQGQSSQQDSEAALSQVCRLFEQSQQQHQEMMNWFIISWCCCWLCSYKRQTCVKAVSLSCWLVWPWVKLWFCGVP